MTPSPEHGERRIGQRMRLKIGRLAVRFTNPDSWLTSAIERAVINETWWANARTAAQEFMASRADRPKTLIVATAQHPLVEGLYPNKEFATRLTVARDHAIALHEQGRLVEIYVPGSPHHHNGVNDLASLASAGQDWLGKNGLPSGITVHGPAANEAYKGEDGVYNSADEAFVSAGLFKGDEDFSSLVVVSAPGQASRWELHAIANGVVPHMRQVGIEGQMHHGNENAQDRLLNYTRYVDPTWQSSASFMGALTRHLRQPR